jgi:hypothetical protein
MSDEKKIEHTEEEKALQTAELQHVKALTNLATTSEKRDKIVKEVASEILARTYGVREMSMASLLKLLKDLKG